MTRFLTALAVAIAAACALAAPAFADTYCVAPDTSCDASHQFGPGAVNAQSALDQAGSHLGPDTVKLGAATYTAPADNGFEYNGGDAVTIAGAGAGQTILTEEDTSSGHFVLRVAAGAGRSSVSALSVRIPGSASGSNTGIVTLSPTDISDVDIDATGAAAGSASVFGINSQADSSFARGTISLPPGTSGNSTAVRVEIQGFSVADAQVASSSGVVSSSSALTTIQRASLAGEHPVTALGSTVSVSDSDLRPGGGLVPIGLAAQASASSDATISAKHVTIVGGAGTAGAGSEGDAAGHSGNVTLRESIVWVAGKPLWRIPHSPGDANIDADYNDYDPAGTNQDPPGGGSLSDTHRRTDDPHFVDAAGGNYRLRFDSPLIDAGNPADPLGMTESATDRDGAPRIVDGNGDGSPVRDMGAFEYGRRAPTATATATPARGPRSTAFAFHGAGSDPDAGDTLSYAWRFDDGATASGPDVQHSFAGLGPHTATLTVTDPTGLSATTTTTATVDPGAFTGVVISRRAVRANRRRLVPLRVTCPAATSSVRCAGRLRLTVRTRTTRGRRVTVALGARRFSIPVGATRTVKVRLSRSGMARLRRAKRLRVIAIATAHDARNVTVTRRRTITVRAPRRH
jgi:hypothetical protein